MAEEEVTEWGVADEEGFVWAMQIGSSDWCAETAERHGHNLVNRALVIGSENRAILTGPWNPAERVGVMSDFPLSGVPDRLNGVNEEWQHLRLFRAHPALAKTGSAHIDNPSGLPAAVCVTCGEVILKEAIV